MKVNVFSTPPVRFVLKIVKEHRGKLIRTSIIIFVLRVISLLAPLFTMMLIDDILPNMRKNALLVVLVAMIGVYVVETILSVFVDWMLFSTINKISANISCDLFSAVFKLPLGFFKIIRFGDTISKLGVISTLQEQFSEEPMHLVMDTFFGIVFLFFLLYLSPILTLCAVLIVPVEFFVSYLWTKIRKEKADEAINLNNAHSGTLVESLSGVETIYQMDCFDFFSKIWLHEVIKIIKNSVSLKKIDMVFSLILVGFEKFSSIFIWIYGIVLIMNYEIKLGQFIAFTSYIGHLTCPIFRLCQLWKDFQTTTIAVDKLKDIITPETTTNMVESLPLIDINIGKIEVQNLTFSHRNELKPIFNQLSLTINPKEKIGIIGPSGCGKTTFVNILQKLEKPLEGQIFIDGQNIALVDSCSLRKHFGVVSQTGVLFNKSIAEIYRLVWKTLLSTRL